MSRRICWVWVVVLLGLIIALFLARFVSSGEAEASLQRFDRDVRASTEILDGLAVQNRGRIKPLDSFARERLFDIFGERACAGLKPTLVILSWALCPDGWSEKPIIKLAPALTAEFCDGNASISATHISPKQLREKLHARAGSAMTGSSDRKKSRSWRKLKKRLMRFNMLAGDLRLFPRGGAEGWIALGAEAALEIDGARDAYKMLTSSLDTLDVRQYNEAASRLAAISSSTDDGFHPPRWRLVLEVHYNRIGPFWLLAVMYLAIALIYSLGYVTNSGKLARAASVVLYPVAAFHILAIVTRGIIAEKAMASNTYEYILVMTAVTAIAALVLKARLKAPVFGLIGDTLCGVGLAATVLSPLSETVSQLPPVLKSDWMSYHVGAAALSYGVLYLAFGVCIAFLLLSGDRQSVLRSRLYETNLTLVRLGFFLLALGIITGAIWADKAWGRYWGWDPKESWSLIAWLIYGIFLHLRLCLPAKKHRATLVFVSIVGFIAVLFTFIGVNYILSGLHSYG